MLKQKIKPFFVIMVLCITVTTQAGKVYAAGSLEMPPRNGNERSIYAGILTDTIAQMVGLIHIPWQNAGDPDNPPTNISLDNSSVAENLSAPALVGHLSTTDPDAEDTFTYTPQNGVPGCDDTDNASFQIGGTAGDELQTAAVFDYETKNTYSICIRTTDSGGLTFDKQFTITVTNVNDPPVITEGDTANIGMSMNGVPHAFDLTLHATDAEADTITWSISSLASHGTASVEGTGNTKPVGYSPALDYVGTDSFVVQASDGNGGTATITVNVNVIRTNVSGTISSDTTWTLENSPYIVTGNLLVNSGVRLTIEPGTLIRFNAGRSLRINGELVAQGTSDHPITFTSNAGSNPGAWGYILFSDSSVDAAYDGDGNYLSGSIIQYAVLEYGGGVSVSDNGALRLGASSPFIDHMTIRYSGSNGIRVFNNGAPKITNSSISNNTGAGIQATGGGTTTISNNVIDGNLGTGITIDGIMSITGNTITNNSGSLGGGIEAGQYSSGSISDNTISGNLSSVNGGGIFADMFSSLTIDSNEIIGNTASGNGGGIASSSAITITNNILLKNSTSGNGGAIWMSDPTYPAVVNHNVIADNRATVAGGGIGNLSGEVGYNSILSNQAGNSSAALYYGNSDFSNNTILNNRSTDSGDLWAVHITDHPTFNNNNLYGNTGYALYNDNSEASADLNAENNWWGTTSDTEIQALIYDWQTETTLGLVDYSPYLTSPNVAAPVSPPTGFTAVPGNTSISLNWSANPESDVAGYKVYWDTDSGYPYANSVDVGNATSYSLDGLAPETTYSIAITAYDTSADGSQDWTDGNESWFSTEAQSWLNHAPTTSGIPNLVVNENAPASNIDLWVSFADIEDTASGLAYTITGNTNPGLFTSVAIPDNRYLNLDYRPATFGAADITVRATDTCGLFIETTFTVTIDTPPVIEEGASTSVTMSEDSSPTPFILTLHATDVNNDILTWGISTQANHGTASASGTGTSMVIGYVPDVNYNGQDSFAVQVDDGHNETDTITVNVTITPVNDPPTDLSLSPTSVAEHAPVGTLVGTFATADPDIGDSFTYNLVPGSGDTDNASFTIVNNQLKTNASFDSNTKTSYSVRVRTTDSGGLFIEQTFTITITDVNDAPTNISLSPSSVAGNMPIDTLVGTFTTTDPDAGDTFTYSLVSGTGSADNASFSILGNQLLTAAVFNSPTQSTYKIRVRTTDSSSLFFEKAFTITVTANNYKPILLAPANGTNLPNKRPTFDWLDVPGAAKYTLQIGKNGDFASLVGTYTLTKSSFTPSSDLPANADLVWRVKIIKTGVPNPWSAVWALHTANPPSIPILLSPINNVLTTDYTPLLDWKNSTVPANAPDFFLYYFQVADNANFDNPAVDLGIAGINNSSYTTPPLLPNTRFYWRVSAYNTAGQYSSWSAVSTFRTALLPPTLRSPLDTGNLLNRRPSLTWNAVDGATSYTIQISKYASFRSLSGTYISPVSHYTFAVDLTADTTFYWRVRSKGANGPSDWSETWSFHTANPPSIPTLLSPVNGALTRDYTPLLDWRNSTVPTNAPAFDKYRLQVWYINGGVATVVRDVYVLGQTNSSFTMDTILAANTTYYWRVSSYNTASQYSAWSAIHYFRTAITPPTLTAPADNSSTNHPRPVFSWSAVTGASGYTIQISKYSNFSRLVGTYNVTTPTYTPTVNLPRVKLYWRVQARGPNGPSDWSVPRTLTITP